MKTYKDIDIEDLDNEEILWNKIQQVSGVIRYLASTIDYSNHTQTEELDDAIRFNDMLLDSYDVVGHRWKKIQGGN